MRVYDIFFSEWTLLRYFLGKTTDFHFFFQSSFFLLLWFRQMILCIQWNSEFHSVVVDVIVIVVVVVVQNFFKFFIENFSLQLALVVCCFFSNSLFQMKIVYFGL